MLSRLLAHVRDERGYTLIELLVATTMALVICMGAYLLLDFTTEDVSRTTSRVHVDQRGRSALERIMEHLHSACVASLVTPVLSNSGPTVLRFISEATESASIASATLHKLTYKPPTAKTEGTLVEHAWKSLETSVAPHYVFNEAEKPKSILLIKGISQTAITEGVKGETVPVFRYYRYYREGDPGAVYGELDPTPISGSLGEAEAALVARVSIAFTLSPEADEGTSFSGKFGAGQPVNFEDSAILRVAPSSSSSVVSNLPCENQI